MQRKARLSRELAKMSNYPESKGIYVFPKDGNSLNVLEAKLIGPESTPYQNGIYKLEISVPDKYPFSPPSVKFVTKIYHPNIDDNGRICLDLLKMPPSGSWKPTIGLEGLLIAIKMLLQYPNPDDPLMADIAEEYKKHKEEFDKKAKKYTEEYAQ